MQLQVQDNHALRVAIGAVVVGSPTTTAPIAKGNTMPPYGGNGVIWQLEAYA